MQKITPNKEFKNYLESICYKDSVEDTKKNMMDTVKYRDSIENEQGYEDVKEMLMLQANSIGMKDYTMDCVIEYLNISSLTNNPMIRIRESNESMKIILDNILENEYTWNDVKNSIYVELINTSPLYVDKVKDSKFNVNYINHEDVDGSMDIRKHAFNGNDNFYYRDGEDDLYNTYEKLRIQHKAIEVDNFFKDYDFTNVDAVDIMEEDIEIEFGELDEDFVFPNVKKDVVREKKKVEIKKPIKSNRKVVKSKEIIVKEVSVGSNTNSLNIDWN